MATPEPNVATSTPEPPRDPSERDDEAREIVRRNTLWSMGLGLVPLPLLDIVAITGIQLKMLNELSRAYDVRFSQNRAKNIIGALVGGVSTVPGAFLLFSALKLIPGFGSTAGAIALPISAGAATMAIGRVFTQHFASGGTFLDFDPEKVREYFKREFESAKETVKELQKQPEAQKVKS